MKRTFVSGIVCVVIFTVGITQRASAEDALRGGSHFSTCFSPNESCDQRIISFINTAKNTLDVAIYSITHEGIADAIIAAKNRGVKIRIVVDRSQSKGAHSLVSTLVSGGVDLKIGNFQGIMHDKFTIVDGTFLETGSYNYTQNATSSNAENQLYIDDAQTVQNYENNFGTIWASAVGS